jgi:hypothetical protein
MFDRATWRGIAIGVVSTAIGLYIVDPLVRYLPSMVLRVAGAMSEGWTDAIYREAAQPEPIETLSVLMLPLLVVILAILLRSGVRHTPKQPNAATEQQTKRPDPILVFLFVIFLAAPLLIAMVRDTSSSIERCFRYRLTVLSPYLSERESKELAASFTLMRGRADFNAIRGRLKEYAEKYKVVPVIKSLEMNQQQGQQEPQWQRRCI